MKANEMRRFRLKDAEDTAPWGSLQPPKYEKLKELWYYEPRQVKFHGQQETSKLTLQLKSDRGTV